MTAYERFARTQSNIAYGLAITFTAGIIALLLVVTGYLVYLGGSSMSLALFTQLPNGYAHGDIGGMKQAIVGTIVLIGLASIIGVPLGVLTGVYLSEYAAGGMLATPVRFLCDVLTGVPSIVVGILGYELLVRPMGHYSGYAGALALAFIMIPIIARTTEEMLKLVPSSYREAAIGLGATKAETILKVVLPAAAGPMVTGVMLAIARVAGETAPLLFTAAGSRFLTLNPNDQFPSLTVQIYDYVRADSHDQNRMGWAGIIVLVGMIFVLNLAIRMVVARRTRIRV
jgi:phosphate transport system permease protein